MKTWDLDAPLRRRRESIGTVPCKTYVARRFDCTACPCTVCGMRKAPQFIAPAINWDRIGAACIAGGAVLVAICYYL